MKKQVPKMIVLHAAVTPDKRLYSIEDVRRWHVDDNGWFDVGYHFYIDFNGVIETGRPCDRQGAHTLGHNKDSIGVCLEGTRKFSSRQADILPEFLNDLCIDYDIPIDMIFGHWDFSQHKNRLCPNISSAFIRTMVHQHRRYLHWRKEAGADSPL